jgi:methylated-DNA-[protein]-cysteine S-methyltransferase
MDHDKRYFEYFQTPYGRMLLVSTVRGLAGAYFVGQKYYPGPGSVSSRDERPRAAAQAKRELREYFAGKRTRFGVPLDPQGTPFQRTVWRQIARVGFGKTISYGELARRAGRPGSARAAGAATGRNPLSIIVPCHRIVGSNGSLTGYAGGLSRKKALLSLEAPTGPISRRWRPSAAAGAAAQRRSSAAPAA